tara:strand:+ start:2558 stop:2932 length:375 start_codon:yes stop_codon:yes gene_type:complete
MEGVLMICGSRHFTKYSIFKKCMDIVLIKMKDDNFEIVKVISGGAKGADTLAERWSKEKGYPFKPYYAEWDSFGKKAGPIRNSAMVRDANRIVAFPYESSTGTHDSIRKAKTFPEKKLYIFKLQ